MGGVKRVPLMKNTTDNPASNVIESCIKMKESIIQPKISTGIIPQYKRLKTCGFMEQKYEFTGNDSFCIYIPSTVTVVSCFNNEINLHRSQDHIKCCAIITGAIYFQLTAMQLDNLLGEA